MTSQVEFDRQGDVTIVMLIGPFMGPEPGFKEALDRITDRRVVMDFACCRLLGSGALAVLYDLARRLRLSGGDVKVTGLPSPRHYGDGPLKFPFEQFETVAQAVAAFTGTR